MGVARVERCRTRCVCPGVSACWGVPRVAERMEHVTSAEAHRLQSVHQGSRLWLKASAFPCLTTSYCHKTSSYIHPRVSTSRPVLRKNTLKKNTTELNHPRAHA